MAEIRPLRAWRYNDQLSKKIDELTSPLFDVVSPKQLKALYANPINSIHISVPKGDQPHISASEVLKKWKDSKVIIQDRLPAIYVYYQYFRLPGENHERCRKGFICMVRAYDWDEEVILRHESTMPHSVKDRKLNLEWTEMNVSPTHGLYTDPGMSLESYLDESMKHPLYTTENYQGVRDVLSIIHDHDVIKKFMQTIKDKKIILADGHHRYEGSIAYKHDMMAKNPDHNGLEPYNYHLIYLTNTEADDFRVLPTHRLVNGVENFSPTKFLASLQKDFKVKHIENPADLNEVIMGKKWAFGLIIGEEAYKIRLKKTRIQKITWNFPEQVKEIDLTVMHFFIFEKILGIKGQKQRSSHNITFERNFTTCLTKVLTKEAQFALITNEIQMSTIKQVCYSGGIMPQKSTYFYPKAICGYLFGTVSVNEFNGEIDTCF